MATLTIPPKYVAGLAKIVSLPDGSVKELLEALSTITPSLDLKTISSAVSSRVSSISRTDVTRIVRTLVSLYSARQYPDTSESTIEEFVDDLYHAMEQSGKKELLVPAENQDRIKNRFKSLFSFEGFNVASKALSLQYEHEHVFCGARILTDARPVYGPNPEAAPNAMVIIHTLRVTYHQGADLKEIYFAMDADDMTKLKALLGRAESKARSLKALFDEVKLHVLS